MSRIHASGLHPVHGGKVTITMGFDQMLNHDTADGYYFNVYDEKAVNDDEDSDDYNPDGQIVEEGFMHGITEERYNALKAEYQVRDERCIQPLRHRTPNMGIRESVPCIECDGKGYLTKVNMHDKELTCSNPECKEQFIDHGKFIEYKNK